MKRTNNFTQIYYSGNGRRVWRKKLKRTLEMYFCMNKLKKKTITNLERKIY